MFYFYVNCGKEWGESCLAREIIVGRVTPSLIFIYLLFVFCFYQMDVDGVSIFPIRDKVYLANISHLPKNIDVKQRKSKT
jgi:hypothetical protein